MAAASGGARVARGVLGDEPHAAVSAIDTGYSGGCRGS